ncbi:hypothetical protein ABXT63_01255 [Candidatus Pelagibacter sp. Uisw_092]|uniref:hypothetical protein n=1 Tax=Candidatus Pelagibacter sp. Uisw_092 TaxID=3230979 RepID=UPI0039E832C0
MKNFLLKLKLLEIKLKTSGTLGYVVYCIIGITVMFIIWGLIFKLGAIIFLTPFLNIKYLGDITLLKLLLIIFGFFFVVALFNNKNSN